MPTKPINSANKRVRSTNDRTNGGEKINYLNLFEKTTHAGWVMLGHCCCCCRCRCGYMRWWPSSLACPFSIVTGRSSGPAGAWIMKSGSSLKSFLINYNYILTRYACAPLGHQFYGQFVPCATLPRPGRASRFLWLINFQLKHFKFANKKCKSSGTKNRNVHDDGYGAHNDWTYVHTDDSAVVHRAHTSHGEMEDKNKNCAWGVCCVRRKSAPNTPLIRLVVYRSNNLQ